MSTLNISLFAVALTVILTLWQSIRRFFLKTSLDNIRGPPSQSFIKGHMVQLFNVNGWGFHHKLMEKFGRIALVHGLFGGKQLYVSDPKALYHIFLKDQDKFDYSESILVTSSVTLGVSMFSTQGEQHRKHRKIMNPVFSAAHLRDMAPLFYNIANKMEIAITKDLLDGPREINILRWMTRAALEMIGQSGLGYSFDPLVDEESENPFTKSVEQLFPTLLKFRFAQEFLLTTAVKIGTPRFRRAVLDLIPLKSLRKLLGIIDVLENTAKEILDGKKEALEKGDEAVKEQVGQGKDIISILLKANSAASEHDRLETEEVLGQITSLVFGAMDTTSTALSRALSTLAKYPETQDKLREEIQEARKRYGEIPHDELMALPYLDAICREIMRLYPPVSVTIRESLQDTVLPLSIPIKGRDGNDIHEIAVPKGTYCYISIINSNRDPTIWGPDALEWRPERWLSPLPETVLEARIPGVYSHLMTFIGGGRSCIGFKFSQLEMKVVLSVLINRYRFHPSKEEIVWEMGPLAIPTLKGKTGKPFLPIKMELLA